MGVRVGTRRGLAIGEAAGTRKTQQTGRGSYTTQLVGRGHLTSSAQTYAPPWKGLSAGSIRCEIHISPTLKRAPLQNTIPPDHSPKVVNPWHLISVNVRGWDGRLDKGFVLGLGVLGAALVLHNGRSERRARRADTTD